MSTTGSFLGPRWSEDQLANLAQMDHDYFPHPWNLEDWLQLNPELYSIYQWHQNGPCGFALLQCIKGDETAHVIKICLVF